MKNSVKMYTTDYLQLNKSEMFAKVRAGLPKSCKQVQNLLDCKDDLLMAWDAEESSLLVLNWRAAQLQGLEKIKYQTLIPSTPQNFQVEKVLASNECSLVALAGPRGVAILELPRRWSSNGQFMDGKEKITCRSSNLSARLFSNNPKLEVRQIRWHPASPTDSHLLVLLNDNSLKIYDNTTLRHVWQVAPVPLNIVGLGEDAVDFDIGPAVTLADAHDNKASETTLDITKSESTLNDTKQDIQKVKRVEWPIVILRENGNIYILMACLDSDKVRLQGPITITPQTADNYGVDSCSVLVIPSLPPTLVIAQSSGKLHHAVLMETEFVEESFTEVDSGLMIYPSEWTLHVLETVELELDLSKHRDKDRNFNCPIELKRDLINELGYFAYHNTGLHAVTVNFIAEFRRFLESPSDIADLTQFTESRAEHLICTTIDYSEFVNPVIGFALLQMPTGVVLLLKSGEVISLKLVINPQLLMKPNKKDTQSNKTTSDLRDNGIEEPDFVDHIKNMLKRTVTQPILSLDKSHTPTPQECYELLTQAVEVFRTEYLERHKAVRAEFTKRINSIMLRKQQQRQDIIDLEHERELIRENAHQLAERFEEINDKQELLSKKCQQLMREAHTRFPKNAVADANFALDVERINKCTQNMKVSLVKVQETINKQIFHIAKYNEDFSGKSYELPEKQEQSIKEILMQMSAEIDGQIKEIKRINKIVGN